jgi:hypothetical protein
VATQLREKPYFHVKPVSEELLDTWHKYLTFQESEGDAARTVKLYERCLVPCVRPISPIPRDLVCVVVCERVLTYVLCVSQCNYVVYWRRYARFVEDTLGAEETARVWERATGKLLKHRPEPFLDFALFQEGQGQTDAARELYKHVLGFGARPLTAIFFAVLATTHTHY